MSDFKKGKFFRLISSLFSLESKIDNKNLEPDKSAFISMDLESSGKIPSKVWKKEYNPKRQLLLWGWDENNNPAFMILYGRHQFKNQKAEGEYILEDEVKYTSYAVFNGKEGHLPSFQAVKIITPYDYKTRSYTLPKMYFKKGLPTRWYWDGDADYLVKGFVNFEPRHQVSYPYFEPQTYDQYMQKLVNRPLNLEYPNLVLKLDGELVQYSQILIEMLSHSNIYLRKKRLSELIAMKPSPRVFSLLLEIGSAEVISGLFLEFAKMADPLLMTEAKSMLQSEINWVDKNYAEGIKRCIRIYLNAIDKDLKVDRIKCIRQNLSKMDLQLISINGKEIPKDQSVSGSAYRKYAASGMLQDYFWTYDYKTRKSSKHEAFNRYETNLYSDGVRLKIIDFKNTIQEAEVYELADCIGKIAYYIDAPRITYYLKGSGKTKVLKYFRRYMKRIINSYAEKSPDKFMEVMRNMLINYNENDCVCKFHDNFQFNELLKYYLYYDFKDKPPVGWEHWDERHSWMSNDQLMRLQGRYEYMKEIWDNHLDIVADIALNAQIGQVLKACYYILKDSPKSAEFIDKMSYQQLINLSISSYKPMAELFMDVLMKKLKQLNFFDSQLMICLIGSADKKIHEAAMEYFRRTKGVFSASDASDLLFLDNLEQWGDLFQSVLLSLTEDEYVEFIGSILSKAKKFLELKIDLSENIRDILSISVNKSQQFAEINRVKLIEQPIAVLLHGQKLPKWTLNFMEELIFAVSYEVLQSELTQFVIAPIDNSTVLRYKRIISVLEAIKNKDIPKNSEIIDILESGTSKMIKMLFDIINENDKKLYSRLATLLIMFESDATVLNEKAKEIFERLAPEKQRKLHAILIDSPIAKAYSFGLEKLNELYGDSIPEEFIIQMLEHSSQEVKAYISDKTDRILDNLGDGNEKLFMYYVKTLLLLPNKISKSKDRIYEAIPKFALKYTNNLEEIQNILLDIGGSNCIIDSERALVALAKIGGEVLLHEN